ncbi:diacylglycerol kinase catalytic region [Thecamonas trahens ATCC 50062]|uniref:Diacylglycerol kinase catalytic region n=1 Tax=Thecamonas trahens ATCC 50062 TaxID=461836 RepID=A0A0L0DSX5_THETB|nr:diacylglycerol kinase catalytic region [Thecamonas trahens ATCC 50062]KNC55454.1 diacylglycerol kinase catalytic region [Thecamonas trahens ATCC 50062]|eukprot:XP_013752990.1 diacylglycerol kinase catalytic region [Thecamonas trahens ATCC 50062]
MARVVVVVVDIPLLPSLRVASWLLVAPSTLIVWWRSPLSSTPQSRQAAVLAAAVAALMVLPVPTCGGGLDADSEDDVGVDGHHVGGGFDGAHHDVKIRMLQLTSTSTAIVANLLNALAEILPPPPQSSALVYNPASGNGKLHTNFLAGAADLAHLQSLQVELVETEAPQDATRWAASLDADVASRWDYIAVGGGDGTLYEVVQGLFSHPRWKELAKIPLIPVPLGSGNGLALSLGISSPTMALVAMARGLVRPLDAASVWLSATKRRISFLSLQWAFHADVDIDSEKWRWMGDTRFSVYGALRCIAIRKYPGYVVYQESDEAVSPEFCHAAVRCPGCEAEANHSSVSCSVSGGRSSASDDGSYSSTNSLQAETETDSLSLSSSASASVSASASISDEMIVHGPPASAAVAALHFVFDETPESASLAGRDDEFAVAAGVDDFAVVSGEHVMFLATNVPTVAKGMVFSRHAHASDGAWDLTFMQHASRLGLLGMFSQIEDGSYADADNVTQVKSRVFALLPGLRSKSRPSHVVIDGEPVRYGPVIVQVHHALLRVRVPDWAAILSASE